MRHRLILAAALAGAALISSPASAEPDASTFLQRIDQGGAQGEIAKHTLSAYENGLGWANAHLENEGQRRLYCPPGQLALTPDQVVDIFRRFVARNPEAGNSPAGMVLLFALQDTFPCPAT